MGQNAFLLAPRVEAARDAFEGRLVLMCFDQLVTRKEVGEQILGGLMEDRIDLSARPRNEAVTERGARACRVLNVVRGRRAFKLNEHRSKICKRASKILGGDKIDIGSEWRTTIDGTFAEDWATIKSQLAHGSQWRFADSDYVAHESESGAHPCG